MASVSKVGRIVALCQKCKGELSLWEKCKKPTDLWSDFIFSLVQVWGCCRI